ncbi:protease inhibitor I42 family protein [Brevibacillus sp. 179-C9.3 HS]|uniref:protease inhibitor I42 family protein n=1 Tax=unclassified Brevibacillus TaxID=2684853 RepID=UPI0039A24C82
MVRTSTYTIQVTAGHLFTITLEANPSTGYQWGLSNPLDARFLSLHSNEFVPPSSPSRIGQGGHQVLSFQALRRGMTSISMKYCRPWDRGDCGEFVFYVVTIF